MNEMLKKLCTPAYVYLLIAVFTALVALLNSHSVMSVIVNMLFALVWTYILSWLCKQGYESLSWFLVLLPYIILLLGIMGVLKMMKM